MDLVTDIFQRYRISGRLIWNLFFLPDVQLATWDGRDDFERIKTLLFESLVLRKLSLDASAAQFVVIPRAQGGIPVQIEQPRKGDQNHYWDHPISVLKPGEAILDFLDYFDWDPLGCIDFKYVRVRIRQFPIQEDLVGREALLEAEHVDIAMIAPIT